MPAAEAHVLTDQASRYLIQLCQHASHMDRIRHRPPTRHGPGHTTPEVEHVDYSETRGIIRFAEGQWTLQAIPGMLTLRVEAADEESLVRLQEGITRRLETIGGRDHLAVTWDLP